MKFTGILCVLLILTMVFVPLLSLKNTSLFQNEERQTPVFANKVQELPQKISIYHVDTQKVEELNLSDYTVLSVCAEISPEYNEQAIMAQAVACRTYAVYMIRKGTYDKADISDDYSIHQGYIGKESLKEKWGNKFDEYFKKISSCVSKTDGKVMTFEGEIIQPAYFALCGGKTENAADIWGGDTQYLKSVVSVGDEFAPDLKSITKISKDEFENCCKKIEGFKLSDDPENWIENIKKTAAGAVKSVTVGGVNISGSTAQRIFELNSNNFTVEYTDDCFVFTVIGSGHGVGMSQYGANYMANQGSKYDEILMHYYTGIELS